MPRSNERRDATCAAFAIAAALALAPARADEAGEFGGHLRAEVIRVQQAPDGPLADAARIAPGVAVPPASSRTVEAELRGRWRALTAVGTVRQQRQDGDRWRTQGEVDELYAAGGSDTWSVAAGRRIVGWDVGYAFRPNDVVQQETRRTLLAVTPQGRGVLMLERFDSERALTLVVVNPTHGLDARGGEEPALAARAYGRSGALDAYGFARAGRRTGAGVGAALAWVADEAMELHASARWANAVDTTAPDAALVDARTGLAARDPWAPATVRHVAQVLAGGTWTNAAQLSLLAEAWWDGAARSGAQWEAWRTRNATLVAERHAPVPPAAVAGNLGWQARAVGDTTSVRRANLFARASWTSGPWQPALDVLLTPEDRGHVLTASLGWQGDRTRVDAGWRHYGGAPDAIYALLPTRRLGYVAATWTF